MLAQIVYFVYNYVTVLHQNVNGLLTKSDMISVCIENLTSQGISVDIVCITEHNMTSGDELYLNMPNYRLASHFMRVNRHGGSCILIKNNFKYRQLHDITKLSISNLLECSAIELLEHGLSVLCIYRPPNQSVGTMNSCLDTLNRILSRICFKNKKVIVCGDFNIDILKDTKFSKDFIELLASFNLKLEFEQATRFTSKTCIDNIAHNIKGGKGTIKELSISDHCAQIFKVPVKKTCTLKYWYQFKRDYSQDNRAIFKKFLKQLSNNDVLEYTDPNKAFDKFHENFLLLYDLCFPIKRIKLYSKAKPKWMSRGIKNCSKRKCELLWQYRKNPSHANKNAFKTYAKRYKAIIYLTKKSQNDYYIRSATNKSKATWKIINQIKNNYPKESVHQLYNNNNILINDPTDIAQTFNDFFLDININKTNSNNNNEQILSDKMTLNSNSIFMMPVAPLDIHQIIKTLKNTNSSGYDGIMTKIIKDVGEIICEPLSYCVNLCIEEGVFPDKLKISVIKPIFKKGDKTNMNNYRPIALIPIFAKIFESVIYKCLYTFFENNNILTPSQYGFRKNKSVNLAIYNFLNKIMTNLDKGLPAVALYMDMSKAFDRVDHNILLNKMYAYGVRGNVYDLIKSYLSNRKQFTELKKLNPITKIEEVYCSKTGLVKFGVPQGTIVGPLFFLIYINDMPSITKHDITLFADDSTILFTDNNFNNLETDINQTLQTIMNWTNKNHLVLNFDKTTIMSFKIRTNRTAALRIQYLDNDVDETEGTKFLGLHIDSRINWKSHIDHLCKTLSQFSYALYSLKKVVNTSALLTAYHGYVSSTLRYGVIFWGNSTDKERAFKAQKRCIRAMFNLHQIESCKPFFKNQKILTLPCLYIFECAIFVKNNINLFEYRSRVRHQDKLCTIASRTHFLHESIFCMAPCIFNQIPCSIRAISELSIFKKTLHEMLVEKCYYSVKDFIADKSLLRK